MGLDMYLTGKRYISKLVDEGDTERAEAIQKLFPELASCVGRFGNASPVKEVCIEAGYWRKANQIHNWFVKNVQEDKDECKPHHVYREQLIELRDLCKQVLEDRLMAGKLLPCSSGFFFGGTEYDDWYFDQLETTVSILNNALALPESWDFEYCSSW